jgi:flagellar protein FliO/FliZ
MQSRIDAYRNLHVAITVTFCFVPMTAYAQTDASVGGALVSMLVPLVLVVGAMLGALVLVRRRYGLTSSDGPLRIRQILSVGPRERLMLVEADGQRLVIGVTGTTITRIATLNAHSDSGQPVEQSRVET